MSKSKKPSKKYNDAANNLINLEKIRQAGICRRYEQLKDQGFSARECLEKTAEFARLSERQTKGILMDQKQPTGRKTSSVSEYLEKIEMAESALKKAYNQKTDQTYEEILREIQHDPNLNEEEKRALQSALDSSKQETKKLSSSQNTPLKKPQFKSLADIIKNADTEEN